MRLLVVNPYGVGDVLCSLPLVHALREARPLERLGYVCNRRAESLVRIVPGVDEVIVFEKDDFRQLWRQSKVRWSRAIQAFAGTIRRGRWEAAIDLSLNWQFGAALAALGIPARYGFDFRRRGRWLTRRLPLTGFDHRHVADYYLDLLSLLGIPRPVQPVLQLPISEPLLQESRAWLAHQGVTHDAPILGIVPGGGASWGPNAPAKQWPAQRFAILADRLAADVPAAQTVLFGDRADRAICDTVAWTMHRPAIVVGAAPSLAVLAGALASCRLVVGNDSGPLHLAVAVGTPTVTIFGPASPVVYGPHPSITPGRHRVAVKRLACRPCYRQFRLPPCPWNLRCLTTLTPDDVYHTAADLLAA